MIKSGDTVIYHAGHKFKNGKMKNKFYPKPNNLPYTILLDLENDKYYAAGK